MNTADQFEVDYGGLYAMYRQVYLKQIFSCRTAWSVKKIAIKSLWYMWSWK